MNDEKINITYYNIIIITVYYGYNINTLIIIADVNGLYAFIDIQRINLKNR